MPKSVNPLAPLLLPGKLPDRRDAQELNALPIGASLLYLHDSHSGKCFLVDTGASRSVLPCHSSRPTTGPTLPALMAVSSPLGVLARFPSSLVLNITPILSSWPLSIAPSSILIFCPPIVCLWMPPPARLSPPILFSPWSSPVPPLPPHPWLLPCFL